MLKTKLNQFVVLFVLTVPCSASDVHTYRVLDTATDLPIPDVVVRISSNGTPPKIGDPNTISLGGQRLKSDKNGEFILSSTKVNPVDVKLRKKGYSRKPNVKEYRLRKTSPDANPIIFYLTPEADLLLEYVKFLVASSIDALEHNKKHPQELRYSLIDIVTNYGKVKSQVEQQREKLALKGFCQIVPTMKLYIDAEWWSEARYLQVLKNDAQTLIDDCK